jgi:hypothetical protein
VADYTTTTLLADIRLGAMLPAASSATFSDAELLRIADEEMQSAIVPLIIKAREDFFVTSSDFTIDATVRASGIAIPRRAIGGKVRDIKRIIAGVTHPQPLPRLDFDMPRDGLVGYYVEGQRIKLVGSFDGTLRVSILRRPGQLVPRASTGAIATINAARTIVTFTDGFIPSGTRFDVVQAWAGYDTHVEAGVAAWGAPSLTFTIPLPAAVRIGDYVCPTEESPVPQIPPEMHPLLSKRVVARVLEALGDREGMAAAQAKVSELQRDALALVSPRVESAPKKIVNQSSPWRL